MGTCKISHSLAKKQEKRPINRIFSKDEFEKWFDISSNGCWVWNKSISNTTGYGQITIKVTGEAWLFAPIRLTVWLAKPL
jgi:hypothetical protein